MENFKGTKEPWRIADDDPGFSSVASDTYHQIKSGDGYHDEKKNKGFMISGFMSIHDAKLISAAPDLLEALQRMVSKAHKQNWNDAYPEELQSAQAAIKKALGEKTMKLIDLLVKELTKRGGWPDGADGCYWHSGFSNVYFYNDGCDVECSPQLSTAGIHYNGDDEGESVTRAEYEAALAKNDGWIEWGGGECPVHGTVYVDVKLRSGHVTTERRAYSLDWNTPDGDDAIIAYRLHSDIESRDNDDQLEQDLNECIGQGVGPAWHGEGLPPVGAKCEYSLNSGATWFKCKIDYILGTQGLVMLADVFEGGQWVSFHEYDGKLKFRPIRTEAEKAREETIGAIRKLLDAGVSNVQDG